MQKVHSSEVLHAVIVHITIIAVVITERGEGKVQRATGVIKCKYQFFSKNTTISK